MPGFSRISANEAKQLIEESQAAVADIRDERSFGMGRIPGAVKIDNSNVQEFMAEADMEKPLIVCCYHGNMSQSGASFFVQHGFKKTFSLDGGFSGWNMLFPDRVER